MQTFQITFKMYDATGFLVRSGTMRCKSKPSEEVAKQVLEAHLKRKVPEAHRVVFISCVNETQQKEQEGLLSLARKVVGNKPPVREKPTKRERTLKDLHRELFLDKVK